MEISFHTQCKEITVGVLHSTHSEGYNPFFLSDPV